VQIPAFAASKENVSITGGLGGSDVNLCDREKQFHVCAMANCTELFPALTWCCQLLLCGQVNHWRCERAQGRARTDVTRAFVAETRTNVYSEVEGMCAPHAIGLSCVFFFTCRCHELPRAGPRCTAASRAGARRQWVTPRPFQCMSQAQGAFISKLKLSDHIKTERCPCTSAKAAQQVNNKRRCDACQGFGIQGAATPMLARASVRDPPRAGAA
jgi:hypothetical protein